jgi:hypothetical protein
VANFGHLAEGEPTQAGRQRNLQSADQRRTDGGDEARASREVKAAEAELDHPEDGNARGRNFYGWVAETAPRYSNGAAILREIDRAPKLASYCLRSDRTKAPVNRSAVARVRRNGALEKTGAYIQSESSQTERCGQNQRTQQSDGHERIKARLGFGNGAKRDFRSSIHGNLQWKNNQLIVCRQKPLCRRRNLNFDCGE